MNTQNSKKKIGSISYVVENLNTHTHSKRSICRFSRFAIALFLLITSFTICFGLNLSFATSSDQNPDQNQSSTISKQPIDQFSSEINDNFAENNDQLSPDFVESTEQLQSKTAESQLTTTNLTPQAAVTITEINDYNDLTNFRDEVNAGADTEGVDINLRASFTFSDNFCDFVPIGSATNPFRGKFNGNGYVLTIPDCNLNANFTNNSNSARVSGINQDLTYRGSTGLFGVVLGSEQNRVEIKNLTISSNITIDEQTDSTNTPLYISMLVVSSYNADISGIQTGSQSNHSKIDIKAKTNSSTTSNYYYIASIAPLSRGSTFNNIKSYTDISFKSTGSRQIYAKVAGIAGDAIPQPTYTLQSRIALMNNIENYGNIQSDTFYGPVSGIIADLNINSSHINISDIKNVSNYGNISKLNSLHTSNNWSVAAGIIGRASVSFFNLDNALNEGNILIDSTGVNQGEAGEIIASGLVGIISQIHSGHAIVPGDLSIVNSKNKGNVSCKLANGNTIASFTVDCAGILGRTAIISYYKYTILLDNLENSGNITIDSLETTKGVSLFASGIYADSYGGQIKNSKNSGNICSNVSGGTGSSYTGGIVGRMLLYTTVENSMNVGKVENNKLNQTGPTLYNGGITGVIMYLTSIASYTEVKIKHAFNFGEIITNKGNYTGGIVGYAQLLNISQVANYGTITATDFAGGLIGYANLESAQTNSPTLASLPLEDSYNAGDVYATATADPWAGGLIAAIRCGNINSVYSRGKVYGTGVVFSPEPNYARTSYQPPSSQPCPTNITNNYEKSDFASFNTLLPFSLQTNGIEPFDFDNASIWTFYKLSTPNNVYDDLAVYEDNTYPILKSTLAGLCSQLNGERPLNSYCQYTDGLHTQGAGPGGGGSGGGGGGGSSPSGPTTPSIPGNPEPGVNCNLSQNGTTCSDNAGNVWEFAGGNWKLVKTGVELGGYVLFMTVLLLISMMISRRVNYQKKRHKNSAINFL